MKTLGIDLESASRMPKAEAHGVAFADFFPVQQRSLGSYIQTLKPVELSHAEHCVFKSPEGTFAIKVTKTGQYGHSVARNPHEANLVEYLYRLVCHNRYFNGGIQLLGCTENRQIVSSQPWVVRKNPPQTITEEQISAYMKERGFSCSEVLPEKYGGRYYYNPREKPLLAVVDANPPNVWISQDDRVVPIDIVIGIPSTKKQEELLAEAGPENGSG